MPRNRPAVMRTYHCHHCGAIVALLVPGALLYDTRLQCAQCATQLKIIKTVDNKRQDGYDVVGAQSLSPGDHP